MVAPTIGDFIYYGLVQVSEAKIIQELENQYLVEYGDKTVNYWKKDGICKTKVECLDILINILTKQKELDLADANAVAVASDVIEGSVVESMDSEQLVEVADIVDAPIASNVSEPIVVAEVPNEV